MKVLLFLISLIQSQIDPVLCTLALKHCSGGIFSIVQEFEEKHYHPDPDVLKGFFDDLQEYYDFCTNVEYDVT